MCKKLIIKRKVIMQNFKPYLIVAALGILTFHLKAQVTDIDGNTYATTKIGEQEWMAENLGVTHFNNGDPLTKYPPDLPETASRDEWSLWFQENNQAPQYMKSAFDEEKGLTYNPYVSRPYLREAESRNICPFGWHIPTQVDWDILVETLGGQSAAGDRLKSEKGWTDGENGNNDSGFNAKPGFNSSQYGPGLQVIWWATMGSRSLVSHKTMADMSNYDGSGMIMNRYGEFEEAQWYYIRCVKD